MGGQVCCFHRCYLKLLTFQLVLCVSYDDDLRPYSFETLEQQEQRQRTRAMHGHALTALASSGVPAIPAQYGKGSSAALQACAVTVFILCLGRERHEKRVGQRHTQ